MALLGALVSRREPVRIGLLGRVFTGEAPWLLAVLLGMAAVICVLIPWLALVRERDVDRPALNDQT